MYKKRERLILNLTKLVFTEDPQKKIYVYSKI